MKVLTAQEYALTHYGTVLNCDECCEVVDKAVEVGETPDHASRTAFLCAKCLTAALALLERPTYTRTCRETHTHSASARPQVDMPSTCSRCGKPATGWTRGVHEREPRDGEQPNFIYYEADQEGAGWCDEHLPSIETRAHP